MTGGNVPHTNAAAMTAPGSEPAGGEQTVAVQDVVPVKVAVEAEKHARTVTDSEKPPRNTSPYRATSPGTAPRAPGRDAGEPSRGPSPWQQR